VCLAGVSLLAAHTYAGSSDGSRSNGAAGCGAAQVALPNLDLDGVVRLRATLLPALAELGGRRYEGGTVAPGNLWSDAHPRPLRLSRERGGRWPAGYEIRQYLPGSDNVGADALLFAQASQAQQVFDEASRARCYPAGVAEAARTPPRALNLTWLNPDGFTEEDVLLLRGRTLFRIADVRSRSTAGQRTAGLATVDRLACALPAAECWPRSGPAPARSSMSIA